MAGQLQSRLGSSKEARAPRDTITPSAKPSPHPRRSAPAGDRRGGSRATGATGARLGQTAASGGEITGPGDRLELPISAGQESFGTLVSSAAPSRPNSGDRGVARVARAIALGNTNTSCRQQALVGGLTGLAVPQCGGAHLGDRAPTVSGNAGHGARDLDDFRRSTTTTRDGDDVLASLPPCCGPPSATRTSRAAGAASSCAPARWSAPRSCRPRALVARGRRFLSAEGSVVSVTASYVA